MNKTQYNQPIINNQSNDQCIFLPDSSLVYTYLYTIISLVGIITNLLSTVNFVQMVLFIKLDGQMF